MSTSSKTSGPDAANIPAPRLEDQLRAMLMRYGFTSVFDLSSPWENTRRIRARIESGEVAGPRHSIYRSGDRWGRLDAAG